ncbi:hypothetical protein [Legionella maioricensis]|uniref:Uncharacterized protein n=1 Tax=Legionella maioricensis TaxID=2896528 RepID=A0A9X2IC05_9GAMM|nr:hypothetical protein [Legionella maioricensis]MCL9683228.1 hypothetical protein [Legionella maioricensis]MCL9686074.1 hypothetical protein [Legionella maioricensis]
MKFEQIDAALNKAGFQLVKDGIGFGVAEGWPSYLYQKGISERVFQTIQVAVSPKDANIVHLCFSLNVPVSVRDLIYAITNEENVENGMKADIR